MRRSGGLGLVLAFLVLPLSGCLESGDETAVPVDPEAADPSLAAAMEAELGSITGVVRAANLTPLRGATVAATPDDAESPAATARADEGGRFMFDDLAPGTYLVQAAAFDHHPAHDRVEVRAGEATPLHLILEPQPVVEPYSVRLDHKGLMTFGAAVGEAKYTNGFEDPNHRTTFDVEVLPEALETLMLRIAWDDETVLLAMNLWYNVTCSPCEFEHEFAAAQGDGEITVRLDRPERGWPALRETNETLWVFVWPASSEEQPVSAGYQTAFDVQVELFYHQPAPIDHRLDAAA